MVETLFFARVKDLIQHENYFEAKALIEKLPLQYSVKAEPLLTQERISDLIDYLELKMKSPAQAILDEMQKDAA